MGIEEIHRFDPELPIEEAITPPYTWYTDSAIFELEKKEVFERSWMAVGRLDELVEVGDYITGDVAGNPFVVTRDANHQLRAFHNVCRHHAALVVQECGSCTEFVCPYHGWTYRLDGSLRKAPRLGKLSHFRPDDYGLLPISVETWGPFVLLDMDGPLGGSDNPRNLDADIGPIKQPLEELGLSRMKFVERRVYDLKCNWKVFVDNSLDGGYHVAYAHETLAEGLEFQGYQTELFDRSAIQYCETRGTDSRLGDKVLYAWLFPNFFINRYGSMMDTNLVMPLSVDRCRVIFDFYFDYDNLSDWTTKKQIRKQIEASDSVQREDVVICESAQRGMRSMAGKHGVYSTILEGAVHAFHVLLRKELLSA